MEIQFPEYADYGLCVAVDDGVYSVVQEGIRKDYVPGGMICELMRFKPKAVREMIVAIPDLLAPFYPESALGHILEIHRLSMETGTDLISTIMLRRGLQDALFSYVGSSEENGTAEIMGIIEKRVAKTNMLSGTPFESFGFGTMGQALLTLFMYACLTIETAKAEFQKVFIQGNRTDDEYQKDVLKFLEFYYELMELQELDAKIILNRDHYAMLYTIKSPLTLLLFEVANYTKGNKHVTRCKNCGYYFVPTGRRDTVYCSYPAPNRSDGKTCSAIGAQIAQRNKEQNSEAERAYRKTYMRVRKRAMRHQTDRSCQNAYEMLTGSIKAWRKALQLGTSTTGEFLNWLDNFK